VQSSAGSTAASRLRFENREIRRIAFSVDNIDEALAVAARHGCYPLRGVSTYQDVYKLTYVRGPSGIIVMLAQELHEN
jgi:glyoxylase I family protein